MNVVLHVLTPPYAKMLKDARAYEKCTILCHARAHDPNTGVKAKLSNWRSLTNDPRPHIYVKMSGFVPCITFWSLVSIISIKTIVIKT